MDTVKICDCGHAPSEHSSIATGYGTDNNGKTRCYACCTAADKEQMDTADHVTHYLSEDGKRLVNWPGYYLGRVTRTGARHPFSRERYYVNVCDFAGRMWHGVGAPGMWCTLRKCKASR